MSRLAMRWGGSGRIPGGDEQTVSGCQQWTQIASCPSSSEDSELTSGHLVTHPIFIHFTTPTGSQTQCLCSENIMLTKTDTVPALMDLRMDPAWERQLVYLIR